VGGVHASADSPRGRLSLAKRQAGRGAGRGAGHPLLGLCAAGVCHQQCAVVLQQQVLDLVLGGLVNVLLVVGDDGLGQGLADGCGARRARGRACETACRGGGGGDAAACCAVPWTAGAAAVAGCSRQPGLLVAACWLVAALPCQRQPPTHLCVAPVTDAGTAGLPPPPARMPHHASAALPLPPLAPLLPAWLRRQLAAGAVAC